MTPEQRALRNALAAVPDRLADVIPRAAPAPPGEWTPEQIVRHLLAVDEQVWLPRLDALADDVEPYWPWYEPGLSDVEATGWQAVLELFRATRGRIVAHLDGLDAARWARSGVHATYGRLDVAALMRRALAHDGEHLETLGAGIAIDSRRPPTAPATR
jgi:hypothetical protein